jgi:DNA-binding CsgD family transcriptional regulator
MRGFGRSGSYEQLLMELMVALSSSLKLTEVLGRSYDVLSRAVVADYAAVCVSKPGLPSEYDWAVAKMPPEFFARYPELADEDFVRRAVVQRPNRVLRDSEMVSRAELKRSTLYEHCRELKMPLEHVMAVMLDVGLDWHGGFTLYREGQRPFSDEEQRFLQGLTPVLASTVRNCRLMSEVVERGDILDELFHQEGIESVVLVPPATELMRTTRATTLLQKWFAPIECGRFGLPTVLLDQLTRLVGSSGPVGIGQDTWERLGPDQSLKVTFVRLPNQDGRRPWALLFQEVLKAESVPLEWRSKERKDERLTVREVEVAERVLKGWDNQLIADDLRCSVETVKTHLKKIFIKLRIASRSKLISAAAELNARGGPRAQ